MDNSSCTNKTCEATRKAWDGWHFFTKATLYSTIAAVAVLALLAIVIP